MAESFSKEYPLGSPLGHIKMCESHGVHIDIICEDCDKFICVKCAKTNHKDHEWNTLSTAATHWRRDLLTFLTKIKENDLSGINEKISKTITENEKVCDSEIKKLQMHYDEIMTRLTEIKIRREEKLRNNLVKKHDQFNQVKSELDKKKKRIVDTVEFMEENNSTMSDYSLIYNIKEITNMLSELDNHVTNCEYSERYIRGEIHDKLLKALVGRTLDLDDIGLTQINSYQYGSQIIQLLETFSEDQCYINELNSKYIEKVNQQGIKGLNIRMKPTGMCVTNNGDVYISDEYNNSIGYLSPSGSVSTVISTDPLLPMGICQSMDGGLLVTLRDIITDVFELESHSRRLVRHVTVAGDVIHEYEYQEDGQTRLFTLPDRVAQNNNGDICVVNHKNLFKGDLVILSSSDHIKFVYRGQNVAKKFAPADVVCDSLCNILVTDCDNNHIHLLSPDGEFLKFFLTENDVNCPFSLSLYKSTLWVGYWDGLVKVFEYRM